MKTKIIHKTTEINASPTKVWEVLLNSPYIEDWYAEFGEDLQTETNWVPGSSYKVVGSDGWGMTGKISENTPNKTLSIEYTGIVKDGADDFESPEAVKWKGHHETYKLSEIQNGTELDIEVATFDEYYDAMSGMWDKALIKIKNLAEKI